MPENGNSFGDYRIMKYKYLIFILVSTFISYSQKYVVEKVLITETIEKKNTYQRFPD